MTRYYYMEIDCPEENRHFRTEYFRRLTKTEVTEKRTDIVPVYSEGKESKKCACSGSMFLKFPDTGNRGFEVSFEKLIGNKCALKVSKKSIGKGQVNYLAKYFGIDLIKNPIQ